MASPQTDWLGCLSPFWSVWYLHLINQSIKSHRTGNEPRSDLSFAAGNAAMCKSLQTKPEMAPGGSTGYAQRS